jgi:hypothetical protein
MYLTLLIILVILVIPTIPIFPVIGVWQGVAMDSLKFNRSCHALLFYALQVGHPKTAWPPYGWFAAVFYPLGHPTPYPFVHSHIVT